MTLGYNNLLVRWAYLFNKGTPNETTRKDFFYRALVLVPGIVLTIVTALVGLGWFIWHYPRLAALLPYVLWLVGIVIYNVVRIDQLGDVHMFHMLREKYKIYFE